MQYFLRDNRPLAYGLIGLLCLLGYYFVVWRRVGQDPPRGVLVPQYRPPEGESPASMRYMELMGYDNRCFVSAILSLAVKGYLSIEQEGGGLLRKGKYTLRRSQGSTTPLTTDEDALLRTVFANGDSLLLDDQNHAILRRAQKAHEWELRQKYFKTFFRINRGWGFLGSVLSLLVITLGVVMPAVHDGYGIEWFIVTPGGWATVAVALTGLVVTGPFGKLPPHLALPKAETAALTLAGTAVSISEDEWGRIRRDPAPPAGSSSPPCRTPSPQPSACATHAFSGSPQVAG